MTGQIADPGLQPERTELAWRRTALALAVGSLVAIKLLPDRLGSTLWVIPGILGLLTAGFLWVAVRRRTRAATAALASDHATAMPDGALLLVVSVLMTCAGLLGVVAGALVTLG